MLTVVHFLDSPSFGGTEQVVLHLLASLDRSRWRHLLYYHAGPGITALVDGARRLSIESKAVPRMQGAAALAGFMQFLAQLKADQATIFHAHLNWLLSCKYGLIAAAISRVPVRVASSHQYMMPPWGRTVYAQQQVVAATVQRYLAVSGAVALQLEKTFHVRPDKIQVVHNTIPLNGFTSQSDPGKRAELWGETSRPIVLTVARLDKQKGLAYLLEAATLVPEASFVLAGSGPERGALESQVRAQGLEGRVRFLGYRQDVPELLASCDVFVLPSLYEGFSVSILEAMAAGKPVVATDVGGTREALIHGETGFLVPPGDSAALANAIKTILADSILARKMGGAGRCRVQHEFSAERMGEQVTSVYNELLRACQYVARGV